MRGRSGSMTVTKARKATRWLKSSRRNSTIVLTKVEEEAPLYMHIKRTTVHALHFVSKPSNRANYARRTKEATNASDNVCVSCDGINLRRDNAGQGVFEMRIIEGPLLITVTDAT